MRTMFQEDIANRIIEQLGANPLSIPDLSKKIDRSYHSVRAVARQLEEEGVIIANDNRYRNTRFKLTTGTDSVKVIPFLSMKNERHNLFSFLGLRNNTEPPNAAKASILFPRHITRILNAALDIYKGQDKTKELRLIKAGMEEHLAFLEQAVSLYQQVLKNPVNWNPDTLRRFVNDPNFNAEELLASYNFYFSNKDDNDG